MMIIVLIIIMMMLVLMIIRASIIMMMLSHGAFRQISQSTRSAHCWSDVRRAEERARAERRF